MNDQSSSKKGTGEDGSGVGGGGGDTVEFEPQYETLLLLNLGTHCREWPAGKANAEVLLLEANSRPNEHRDLHGRLSQDSRSSRVEGLCTKTVRPTESGPPVLPWRKKQSHMQYNG